jgi:glycosyltransferase involved in cell wall biosynthesis
MKKVKVLHIIGRLSYGGAENLLLDLCRKIDKTKFDISVLALQGAGSLQPKFEAAGVKVEVMRKRFKGDLAMIRKVKEYIGKQKPDIVHTHLFVGDYYGGQAALKAKVPVIVSTKHDILSEGKVRDFLVHRVHRKINKIVAISRATKDFIIKHEKVPFEKVALIYNGIDSDKFYLPESKIFSQEITKIGAIGRLSPEKGHKYLIRACRFIKDKKWRLLLVGDGAVRKDLERAVQLLDLEGYVTFVGEVEDVRPYLEQIDIFVLPSLSEGLSLAIIEAAFAGRFIIATNVGGVPEIIKDKETGLLFKPKSIEQLVSRLKWAMEHKDEASKMARRLQAEVVDRFDINLIIKQYEQLYYDLLKNKSAR